ncbi:hypothetical protein FG386_003224 [Cryptosporidium ryanae]|uniref:uncharacterized protein n=1 Tax=Cryptosporidium ryanae TaxID=515981 RepID=UPI00351AA164|nr:hypothetical protein FG386_003224 [Cryptosporidium ryanae]
MKNLREILVNRFICLFPSVFQGNFGGSSYLSESDISLIIEDIEGVEFSSEKHFGVLIIILVSFENDKLDKRKLFGLFKKLIVDNALLNCEVKCFQLLCEITELFLNFLIENCKNDINKQFQEDEFGFDSREPNSILRRYILLIQYFLTGIFDTLFLSINTDLVDSDIFCSYCVNVMTELDCFLKNLMISTTVSPVNDIDLKTILDNGLNLQQSLYIYFDQNLLLKILLSLIKIVNIMVRYCKFESISCFLNSYILDKREYKNSDGKVIGKSVCLLILELLSESNVSILNIEIIKSLGLYLSFFLTISRSVSLFSNSNEYIDFKSINSKIGTFINDSKLSGIGLTSIYRGIIISKPLFINSHEKNSLLEKFDSQFFNSSLNYFQDTLKNCCNNNHCLLVVQSISVWTSILIKELSIMNKTLLSESCFNIYLKSIYKIIVMFLDQNNNFYLKSIIQLLETFVEFALTLDYYLEGRILIELNLNPVNWLIDSVLNNNWNNIKCKYFFLEKILSRIIILYKNKSTDYLEFGKLSSIENFKFNLYSEPEYELIDDNETNFLFTLLYSLSIQNTSSSAFNLIVTWYKLNELYHKNYSHAKTHNCNFLDFILFLTVNIINNKFKLQELNIITNEGKYLLFRKLLKILKVTNKKYYEEKLSFIFHLVNTQFCKYEVSFYSNSYLNPFLSLILPEIKKNGTLFWQNCLDENINADNLNLVVVFDVPTTIEFIPSSYIIENISSFNSEIISSILELASIKTRVKSKKIDIECMNLVNELELLFITISNINTIGIQGGIFRKIVILMKEKFDLSKKILLRNELSTLTKQKLCTLLGKIFKFLFTSFGLHISYDKTDLFLQIFLQFINSFYNENIFDYIFEKLICFNSETDFSNNIVSRLQKLLFSTSESTRDCIIKMILKDQKFRNMFCEFHFKLHNFELKEQIDIIKSVFFPLISDLRPREYKASSIILFIYLQKIIDEKNCNKDLFNLLENILNLNSINIPIVSFKSSNILIHVFNSELSSRINKYFIENNLLLILNGENRASIPLHFIVNILGICYKFEMESKNSEDNTLENNIVFFDKVLESLYLLIICLAILLKKINCDLFVKGMGFLEYEDFEYQISQTIEEINILFRMTLTFENSILTNSTKFNISYIVCENHDISIDKELFDLIKSLNSSLFSGNIVSFINVTCNLIIQLILSSDHPGNSNSLQNLFLTFSSYIGNIKSKNSNFCSKNTTNFIIDTVKLKIMVNYELISYLTGQNFNCIMKPSLINNKNKLLVTENTRVYHELIELPKVWIFNLFHSIMLESKETLHTIQSTNSNIEIVSLNYEKIDDIFSIIIQKNSYNYLNDISKYLKYKIYDVIKICDKEYFRVFEIPLPKRNSANLSNTIGTIVCLLLENTEATCFVKTLLKLFIIGSLSSYDPVENNFVLNVNKYLKNTIIANNFVHFNNILALLISKSKTGCGSSSFLELFDIDILCGLLISAFISIKLYNFNIDSNIRFMLCNSSLNLMSSLIKRFAFEHYEGGDYLDDPQNYNDKFEFKKIRNKVNYNYRDIGINISNYYTLSELSGLKKKTVLQYYFSTLTQCKFNFCYSLKFIKKNTDMFELCIIEALLNSNHYQFQGMALLFLSEISISWSECSQNMALSIIKTIYSPSYFIRSYSARLLTNIILKSLNDKDIISPETGTFEDTIDYQILKILSERIISINSRKHSLIYLLCEFIEYSLFCKLPIKYNLLHGALLLGINILKRPNVKFFISIMVSESENISFFIKKNLNLLLQNSSNEIFKSYIIRVSMFDFIDLMLDLEFPNKIEFEMKLKTKLHVNNHFQRAQITAGELEVNPMCFFYQILCDSITECINNVQLLSLRAIKTGRYFELIELNNILFFKKTQTTGTSMFIHPKVLFEFYLIIWENIKSVPKADFNSFMDVIIEIMNFHIESLYDFLIYFNSNIIEEKNTNNLHTILLEAIRVIVEFVSFLARDQNISEIILLNKFPKLNIYLNLKLIEKALFYDYNNPINIKTNSIYTNLKLSTSLLENSEFIQNLIIIYVRFHFPLSYRMEINDFKYIIVSEIFNNYMNGLFSDNSQFNYLNMTELNKHYICSLEETVFLTINYEIKLLGINFINVDTNEIKKVFTVETGTICSYFLLNKNCWYNLMLSLILLSSSEIAEIRLRCQHIFSRHLNTIKHFSEIISGNSSIELNNYTPSSSRSIIHSLIKYNSDNYCIFSLLTMDSLSRIILNTKSKEASVHLFPKEVENIHNDYMFTLKILHNNILKYLALKNGSTISNNQLSEIEFYIGSWEDDISNNFNVFQKIEKSINTVPDELFTIDLFGNILKSEINIYLLVILLMKCEIIIKFETSIGRKNRVSFSIDDIETYRCKLEFILSEVHKNLD